MELRRGTRNLIIIASTLLFTPSCFGESQVEPEVKPRKGPDLEEYARIYQTGSPAVLNNQGIKAMKSKNFAEAKRLFLEALKQNPTYSFAWDNLAILFNNMGLEEKDPKKSMEVFHKAAYIQSGNNKVTIENLNQTIIALKLKPERFEDRVKLGDEAARAGDFASASVEYKAALKIKDDPAIREKLATLPPPKDIPSPDAKPQAKAKPVIETVRVKDPEVLKTFLRGIQSKIKEKWKAPAAMPAGKKAEVFFNLEKDGKISQAAVVVKSENAAVDKAALDTVKQIESLDKPPEWVPDPLTVAVVFERTIGDGYTNVYLPGIDMSTYVENLQRLIKKDWHPPKGRSTSLAIANFLVSSTGTIYSAKLTTPSGQKDYDDAALLAFKNVQAPPIPVGAQQPAEVRFTFTYNVLDHNHPSPAPSPQDLLKRWEDYCTKSPNSSEAHLGYALALEKSGDLQKAKFEFEKVLTIDPNNSTAKQHLAAAESKDEKK